MHLDRWSRYRYFNLATNSTYYKGKVPIVLAIKMHHGTYTNGLYQVFVSQMTKLKMLRENFWFNICIKLLQIFASVADNNVRLALDLQIINIIIIIIIIIIVLN